MKLKNLEAIGKRQCCYRINCVGEIFDSNNDRCIQRVYNKNDKYCYYHKKLVAGLLERWIPDEEET